MKIFWALIISLVIHFGIFLLLNQIDDLTTENKVLNHNQQNTTIRFVKLLEQQTSQPQQTESPQEEKVKKLSHNPKEYILPMKNIVNTSQPEILIPAKLPPKLPINELKEIEKEIAKNLKQQETKQENHKKDLTVENKVLNQNKDLTTENKIINQNKDLTVENKVLNQIDDVTKSYLELYKDDFAKFSSETKIYLIKNIKDIGRITERFLIYPHISIQAKQQGVNVVEFWLYPDGKVSKPKIIKSSNYYILDDNTEETILRAYKDYPRPEKPTVIRIYVRYKLI